MDAVGTTTASPWPRGIGPIAKSALGLAIVDLVLAIVLRASDSTETWTGIVADVHDGFATVVRLLVAWSVIVFVFAFIRRQDPDRARFSVVGTIALWVVILAWITIAVSFAVNDRDRSFGDRVGQAMLGAAMSSEDDYADMEMEAPDADAEVPYPESDDYSDDYSDEDYDY